MNTELDALATRLYVTIDDLLIDHPDWAPERPAIGIAPKLTDAELITLAVIQALLGHTSEARFWRHATTRPCAARKRNDPSPSSRNRSVNHRTSQPNLESPTRARTPRRTQTWPRISNAASSSHSAPLDWRSGNCPFDDSGLTVCH